MKIMILLILIKTVFLYHCECMCQTVSVALDSQRSATIYYEEIGQGRPVIILHRAMSGYLEPIFSEMDDWKRFYIDPPGIGKSSADNWIRNADDCLDILCLTIDDLLPDQSYLLIGFSYFGYMAKGILFKNIEKIDGMLLVCPVVVPLFNQRQLPAQTRTYVDTAFYNNVDDEIKTLIDPLVVKTPESLNAILKYKRDDVLMNIDFWNRIKNTGYSFSFTFDSLRFNKPSLLLLGLQDNVVGYLDGLSISNILTGASIAVLDLASHSLPYEQNELFNLHVKTWLTGVLLKCENIDPQ